MLPDKQTYKKLLKCKMNELLLSFNRSCLIPDNIYHGLRSSAGSTPLLYGLSKFHKLGILLIPIALFIHSPTYKLSKHLIHNITC